MAGRRVKIGMIALLLLGTWLAAGWRLYLVLSGYYVPAPHGYWIITAKRRIRRGTGWTNIPCCLSPATPIKVIGGRASGQGKCSDWTPAPDSELLKWG